MEIAAKAVPSNSPCTDRVALLLLKLTHVFSQKWKKLGSRDMCEDLLFLSRYS